MKATKSKAHSILSERANGIDLVQFSMLTKEQFEYLIFELSGCPTGRFLDLGCGVGRIASEIHDRIGADIMGIDIDEGSISEAESISGRTLEFIQGDFDNYAWTSEQFAAVYSVDTLYFSKNLQALISNLYSSVIPGGKLILFWTQMLEHADNMERLMVNHTDIALALENLSGTVSTRDFTEQERGYWERAYSSIRELEEDFRFEGNYGFFESFSKETDTVLALVKSGRVSRYCYTLVKPVEQDD